jgi:hypothetical protein
MEISIALITAAAGVLVSLIASLLTKFVSDKTLSRKIKIGGVEIQLSESADESTRRILDKVQELQESPQVFLSHSSQDKEFAQRLASDLQMRGVRVWIADEQVKVGDKIIDAIHEGISSSQWVIVLLSENSMRSDFISKELLFALDEEKKKDRPFILPILIGDAELPDSLQDRQYADFRKNYELGLEKILARVKPSATRLHNERITEVFLRLKEKALAIPNQSDRQDIHIIINELEDEVRKSERASEQTLSRLLRNLIRMSPEIGEIALYTIASPAQAISIVSRKIAERIKAEETDGE